MKDAALLFGVALLFAVTGADAGPVTGTLHTFNVNGTWTGGSTTINVASTSGMLVGSAVTSASGVSAGSTITATTPTTLTLSIATSAPGAAQPIVVHSRTITGLSSATGLVTGQLVSGTGVPPGATIFSLDSATQITLNINATGNGPQSLQFSVTLTGTLHSLTLLGNWTAGMATVTVASTAGIVVGSTVTGTGIPAGTSITSVLPTSFIMSAAATSTHTGAPMTVRSADVTGLPSTTLLTVGMSVAGAGIPAGTSVFFIGSPTQVTLSKFATSAGAQKLVFGIAPITLDIDASAPTTKYDALTDGLLVLRYLFKLTGPPLTTNATGATALRSDPVSVLGYLDSAIPFLDVDGNGVADALTDGLLVLRFLFGLQDDPLIANAVDGAASRTTAADIASYLQSLMP